MKYGLQFRDVFAAWEFLLDGLFTTIVLSVATMVGGFLIGIAGAAARVYGGPLLRMVAASYVEVIRNTPLLVQLFLIFFGLPAFGLRLEAVPAAIIALVINLGA